jgi:hypothetical protein
MVALERDNLDLLRAGRGQNPPIAAAAEIRQWATDRGLLADQIEVAQLILTTPDWLTSIESRAGSAKTTTVGAIRETRRGARLRRARLCSDHARRQATLEEPMRQG